MPRDRTELIDGEEESEEGGSEEVNEKASPTEPTQDGSQPNESTGENATNGETSNGQNSSDGENGKEEETVNIQEDWDPTTYYLEPTQVDRVDDEYRSLKRTMKREEEIHLQKHRHFIRALFNVGIENIDEVKKQAQELARDDPS